MPGRTSVISISGATLSLSAGLPATYDAAGYGATTITWTAVGEIETYGNHGVKANIGTHTPVDTAVVAKVKGSKDYGSMQLVIGSIPSNTGQALLNTASESNNHYSIKMAYPDGEIHYMDALVSSFEYQDGSVNDLSKVAVSLEICKKPVIVPAS
ncbi:phage tail tube protein [Nitrosomonas oligotropha]|uniref:phage tail tube protein n=1 Tax=Nitrosomonas oligotropha TaxID=42354 RepID=UPI0013707F98|nr:phage tail tube protein [Nitrosomonas oligotropha]MXS81577.1 hypothetical protein [Nitrosomonas oligotropha]